MESEGRDQGMPTGGWRVSCQNERMGKFTWEFPQKVLEALSRGEATKESIEALLVRVEWFMAFIAETALASQEVSGNVISHFDAVFQEEIDRAREVAAEWERRNTDLN